MNQFNKPESNRGEYHIPVEKLFPDLTPDQQREAEYFLNEYLEIIHRIYMESEDLTSSDLNTTV
jgi:hypothetical protein